MPYVVVDSSQDPVQTNLGTLAAESDPGPMPVPANAEWQGYPVTGVGDRHVIVLDNSSRLKAGFNISGFPPEVQVILTALKKYGMIMTDNGAPMFLAGAPDDRWNNTNLHHLTKVTASDFEVVLMSPVYTSYSNVPKGPKPVISAFAATPSSATLQPVPSAAEQPVTLSWNVLYGEYYIVSPQPDAIRGTSVVVNPIATTTYTLYATNPYGRSTATVTVAVP